MADTISPEGSDHPAVAAARQHRAGVRSAGDELERALAAPALDRSRWDERVAAALVGLRQAFVVHVETTEAPDGLLASAVATDPRLAHRSERLQRDHVEILGLIDHLSAGTAATGEQSAEQLRSDALELLTRLSAHRHLGADLVYQAYVVDIEAAD